MKATIKRPDFYEGDKIVTLTAAVKSGSVTKTKDFKFLIKKAVMTDEQKLAEDAQYIRNNIPANITSDVLVMLKTILPYGSEVTWTSSKTTLVTNVGKVTRPDFGLIDEAVVITANLKLGTKTQIVTVNSNVIAMTNADELSIIAAKITWDLIKKDNVDIARVITALNFPAKVDEVDVVWNSTDPRFILPDGTVNRPEYTQDDASISVIATLTKGNNSLQVSIHGLKVLKKAPTPQQRCDEYVNNSTEFVNWITAGNTNNNIDEKSVVEGFVLPAEKDDILLVWSVVNSLGEASTNSYLGITYQDGGDAQGARRYVARVTPPTSASIQTYIKVVATISATTDDDGNAVAGGSATKTYPITILKTISTFGMLENEYIQNDIVEREVIKDNPFSDLVRSDYGRATWSVKEHLELIETENE